jgi:hypothetical protein
MKPSPSANFGQKNSKSLIFVINIKNKNGQQIISHYTVPLNGPLRKFKIARKKKGFD